MKKEFLKQIKEQKDLFEKNNIYKVYLTWSFARWSQNSNSDIDLIYSVKKWKKFSLFNIWNLIFNLEKIFWKKIDLVRDRSIRPELRKYLNADKILIF